jgi:membrane protease YdiL (CAAX protease family)
LKTEVLPCKATRNATHTGSLTQLIFRRPLKELGWKLRPLKWTGWGYLLPLLYALPVYLVAWLTGLGRLHIAGLDPRFASTGSPVSVMLTILVLATLGMAGSLLSATGEEIGWRGFLVPRLAERHPFWRVMLFSGGIWAVWHMPLILTGDYKGATPVWYSLICFTLMVICASAAFAWLRLRSGSLWPAAMLHASHNLFIQGIFDPLTASTGPTPWITGEFGIGLVITTGLLAVLLLRQHKPAAQTHLSKAGLENLTRA